MKKYILNFCQPATSNQQPATSNQQPLNKGNQDKANLFIALQKACVLHLLFLHKKARISSALNSNRLPYLSKNYSLLDIKKGAKFSRSVSPKAEHQNNLVSLPPVYYTGFV